MPIWTDSDESRDRCRRARGGDTAARDALITDNLGLVYRVMARLAPFLAHVPREDLIQEGILGLIEALERFDPDRGTRLSTWAVPYIHGAIWRASWQERGIPRSVEERWRAVQREHDRLMQAAGTTPAVEDIAAALHITPEEVRQALADFACFFPASLDGLAQPSEDPWHELDGRLDAEKAMQTMEEGQQRLDGREQAILRMRHKESMPFKQIAQLQDITTEHARQIYVRAFNKLRRYCAGWA